MYKIKNINARQILDSRGYPTIEVEVLCDNGIRGCAIVPSGASKGIYEACELRDEDMSLYMDKSVFKCVGYVNDCINKRLCGLDVLNQRMLDNLLIELDGTNNKSHLGGNTTLAVSLAIARCGSAVLNIPLYKYIGGCNVYKMPRIMMNIINGGKHASNNLDIQEFMIIPLSSNNMYESIEMGYNVFHTLKQLLHNSGYSISVGDEGGFAPDFKSHEEVLEFMVQAIIKAGYKPGSDIGIGLDVAASELYKNKRYYLNNTSYSSYELLKYYESLADKYPIVSIEDGYDQDDYEGWRMMSKSLGHIMLVGDDLFVTNSSRLKDGMNKDIGNSILIKPNQIGTLSETLDTIELAKCHKYNIIVSHRSGDSEDTFIADLAVGVHAGYIKTGSLSRSERIAKYNQLLRIEENINKKNL